MRIIKFLDGVTADTVSSIYSVDASLYPIMRLQVGIGTAATVIVEGQIEGMDDHWATISDGAITESGAYDQTTMPLMRVTATGVNGALKVYGFAPRQQVLT